MAEPTPCRAQESRCRSRRGGSGGEPAGSELRTGPGPTPSPQRQGRDGSPEKEENGREAAPSPQSRHATLRARADPAGGRPSTLPREEPREDRPGPARPGPAAPAPLTSAIVVVAAILSFPSTARGSRESSAARAGNGGAGGSRETKSREILAGGHVTRAAVKMAPSRSGRGGEVWRVVIPGGAGLQLGCCGAQHPWLSAGPAVPGAAGRSAATGATGGAVTGRTPDKTGSNRLKCRANPAKTG